MSDPGPPARCPASSGPPTWHVTRHADVVAVAQDARSFSSAVSRHLQIPNGLDGAEHARFRPLVESFFTEDRMDALEPDLRAIAAEVVRSLPRDHPVETVADLGRPFAVRATCTWLGWPDSLETTLLDWMRDNHAATRSADHTRTSEVAARFDAIITELTRVRRDAGEAAPGDVTTELTQATVDGRPLEDAEIVSILRNWTAGDIASVALCVGVVVRYLADHPDVQEQVRRSRHDRGALERAIDEMLRIDDPFVANRRVVAEPTEIGGVALDRGDRLQLRWTAANRDPARFGDPDAYRPEENAPHNLVYGTGPHVCPGRSLATLELRVVLEEVLDATTRIDSVGQVVREDPPLGGYASAPVVLRTDASTTGAGSGISAGAPSR
ncbi:cytochrome P450 [Nocardioides massiliensis]|uniref:Cytochrome P450 n=2 Tax=Nocardioides massiliensis TaxID=1325935 RepID=A0ABT9NTI1_9ACTN|nr:cytochrome P450 [Nocardioides massiliensis]MDP9823733.1 cytochrome P450 [Nocardioides massiliensis]